MRTHKTYHLKDPERFKKQLIKWGENQNPCVFLDSSFTNNSSSTSYLKKEYDCIMAVGSESEVFSDGKDSFSLLKDFHSKNKDWLFGLFSYDLKNENEKLYSSNVDNICFPELHFFRPKKILFIKDNILETAYLSAKMDNQADVDFLYINNISLEKHKEKLKIDINLIRSRYTRNEYIATIKKIKQHIQFGDIYELNLCQEFYLEKIELLPIHTYLVLNKVSPTPFSSFYRLNETYLMCASPERFLKKTDRKIYSQPIKGTAARLMNKIDDDIQKDTLRNDPKEIKENIMIVDLVRNDLSKTAEKASVKVEELCGIYSFPQVHQMISTICSTLKKDVAFTDAIKFAFPMGSMTGAPKIRAMELIEKYERTRRGLYSGAVGYISPEEDFDFNVIIRSILYNSEKKYLSYIVGGAITSDSVPEKEYEECMIKAKAMMDTIERL
ncbi:anthranilate synthase component I family protein [Bacteroidota bacterium]